MAEPILMPKLGFDMAEGTLITWTVAVGDTISKGDVIAEIETDKATIEIETTVGGTVLQLLAEAGDIVAVGSPIGYVGAAGEVPPGDGAAPAAATASAGPESVDKPKPPAPVPAPTTLTPPPAASGAPVPGGIKASPVARRIADERGIDLRRVAGSGPGGRIVKKDVEDFPVEEAPAAPLTASAAPAAPVTPGKAPAPVRFDTPTWGTFPAGPDVEAVELSRMRIRIGDRLVQSKQYVPHFYVTTEIDMGAALDLRQQLNTSIDDPASKISVNDLIVKAAAITLRRFPNLNSHFYGDKLARYSRINIGIAVALPQGGLVNVTAYDADTTALGAMAANNRDMIQRARDGKVKPHEIEGATFSVSNLGPYDVDHFMAIINPPEAGILAVGSARKVPVVLEDDTLGVGMRMKATISVDHRVSDGAEAAGYMKFLKDLLENPMRLLI
ncbi:MAG: 2-oxo acid dehydrogenase subunit E2 [Anaerolineae bacterium]|nr:2-oxo acid dehydrogenase subunit E2 [Anaerolineae bacterium]